MLMPGLDREKKQDIAGRVDGVEPSRFACSHENQRAVNGRKSTFGNWRHVRLRSKVLSDSTFGPPLVHRLCLHGARVHLSDEIANRRQALHNVGGTEEKERGRAFLVRVERPTHRLVERKKHEQAEAAKGNQHAHQARFVQIDQVLYRLLVQDTRLGECIVNVHLARIHHRVH